MPSVGAARYLEPNLLAQRCPHDLSPTGGLTLPKAEVRAARRETATPFTRSLGELLYATTSTRVTWP